MSAIDGYEATMQLAEERPELLPLVQLVVEMGSEAFNDGLAELVRRGILDRAVVYDPPTP